MLSICASSRCIGTPARSAGASKTRTAGEEEKEEGACKCSSSSFAAPRRPNSKTGAVSALHAGNKEDEEERGGAAKMRKEDSDAEVGKEEEEEEEASGDKRREKDGKEEEKKEVKAAGARGWFSWGYPYASTRYASTPAAAGEKAAAGKAAAEAKVEHSYLIYYRHYLIYYLRTVPLILANIRQYLCVCESECSSLRVQSVSAIFLGGLYPGSFRSLYLTCMFFFPRKAGFIIDL